MLVSSGHYCVEACDFLPPFTSHHAHWILREFKTCDFLNTFDVLRITARLKIVHPHLPTGNSYDMDYMMLNFVDLLFIPTSSCDPYLIPAFTPELFCLHSKQPTCISDVADVVVNNYIITKQGAQSGQPSQLNQHLQWTKKNKAGIIIKAHVF